jgi:two-component sensor histidine kinase
MVQHLNATFACIWTINEEQHVLQLQVSAGMYTHIDGAHSRVPIGKLKIGLIAKERKPHLTNSVIGDPRVPEQEWAKREGMVAFAGYPLIVDDRVVGVAAMFAHQPLADSTLQALASVADGIALGIKRKQVEEQIKKALKEKEVLLKEIHHRVKNNLQIVSSLLNLQAGRLGNEQLREPFRISQNRLQAMILLHEQLYQSKNLAEIQYGEYITRQAQELFRVYGVDHDTITLQILSENINVNIDKAIPFGLILTELLSNALKYAFPSNKKGTLTIQLSAEHDGFITLRVSDNGVGFPGSLDFRRSDTLGMRLVCALTEQLEGTMELRREGGTEFVIRFPN